MTLSVFGLPRCVVKLLSIEPSPVEDLCTSRRSSDCTEVLPVFSKITLNRQWLRSHGEHVTTLGPMLEPDQPLGGTLPIHPAQREHGDKSRIHRHEPEE